MRNQRATKGLAILKAGPDPEVKSNIRRANAMYADYKFYSDVYLGDTLTENNADRWLDKASDYVDSITFHRLETAFPTDEKSVIKVKKAVCAIADALHYIDMSRRAGAASAGADGRITGAVASISSGRESVSYATGSTASVYSAAASSATAQESYTRYVAQMYLANVADANGVNLLYAGVD